jgi:hypothetical protein
MGWVYGIRCKDVKHPLFTAQVNNMQALVYFVAKIVVILIPQLNRQRYYNYHSN